MPKHELLQKYDLLQFADVARAVRYTYWAHTAQLCVNEAVLWKLHFKCNLLHSASNLLQLQVTEKSMKLLSTTAGIRHY